MKNNCKHHKIKFMNNFLMLIFMSLFLSVEGNAATVNLLSTSLDVIKLNDSFVLELTGSNFNSGSLDGGGVNISFDPSVIAVTNVNVNTSVWEFFSTNGVIDNLFGTVNGISFNSFETRLGNLSLASIEFTAVGLGVSALSLTEYDSNPFSTAGSIYPDLIFDQSMTISVQAVPVPAAIWLFLSGLILMLTQRRRFSMS